MIIRIRKLHFRKRIAALLVIAMLWSLGAWMPVEMRTLAAPTGDLAHEDFEDIAGGNRPAAPWTFPGSTPAGVTANVYVEPSGNHVIKIAQTSSTSYNYGPTYSLQQAVKRAELSYRVKAEQTNGFIYLPRFTIDVVKLGMSDSGSFVIGEGSGWKAVKPYVANRWYEVRVVLDTDTDKYDLYIDNELIVIQRNSNAAVTSVQNVDFGVWRSSKGVFSVDDLNISSFKDADSAAFSQTEYSVDVDGSLPLDLTFSPVDASVRTAVWTTSDPAVAAVNEKGIVTGKSPGAVQITAAPYASGLMPITTTVSVYGVPPTGILLSAYNIQLAAGARSFLSAEVQPSNADGKGVLWSTSDSTVATVSTTGEIRGIGAGTAIITVRSAVNASIQAECSVTVTAESVPTSGDLLSEDFETTAIGTKPAAGWSYGQAPYVTNFKVADSGEGRALAFTQTEKANYSYGVARVLDAPDANKAVLAYRIRAKQTNGFIYIPRLASSTGELVNLGMSESGAFSIWDTSSGTGKWLAVKNYEPDRWYEVRLVLDTATDKFDLFIDEELAASQRAATNPDGLIHQVNMGFYKECIGSFDVDDLNVYSFKNAASASFPHQEYTVPLKGETRLKLDFLPVDAALRSAVWSSDRTDVATVDETGKVKGVSLGTAQITADPLAPGLPAVTTTVHVVEVTPQSVTIDKSTLQLPVGSIDYLSAAVWPVEAANKNVVWSSSNPAVADVQRGEVVALSAGTAVITASAEANSAIYATTAVQIMPRALQHELYVSPGGSDNNPGTEALPFRTLTKAQEAVRGLNDNMTGDIMVYLREGTYTLQSTWTLNEEDSGTNGYAVRWSSYPGEHPVISGGRSITGWTLFDPVNQIYKADVGMDFASRQLFINGVRATRARSQAGLTNAVKTATGYTSDDVSLAGYSRSQDLELVYMEQWTNPRGAVAAVTLNNGKAVIAMDEPGWAAITNKGGTSATYPVYYENAYELLDKEGEWYWNAGTGELFYKPRIWEDMQTVAAMAPVVEELVSIKGSSVDHQASQIMFTGLTFADTTWMRPSTNLGHSDAQNNHLRYPGTTDVLPQAAVTVEYAQAVSFERNVFTRLGITGLKLVNGVQNSLIRGNTFYDISGSAINVGDPYTSAANANPTDPRMQMRNNDVLNNYIHDIGVDYMSAAAISAGFPLDMDISHNEIFNIPYSGLHIGYGWANRFPNILRNMRVENNFVHDLMGNGIYDGGAIYTLGNSGGSADQYNLIAENYIKNQKNDYGPLYTDEGSTFWKLDRNVVDLIETPFWNSGTNRWSLGNSNQDIVFTNNYTTTDRRVSNSPLGNVTETNTRVYPDGAWPEEAVGIIQRSGLTEDYSNLRTNHAERLKILPSELALQSGHSGRLSFIATDGKDQPVDTSGLQVYYQSDDPAVAAVDSNGNITGHETGMTKVHLYVLDGTLLKTFVSTVYVNDYLEQIALEKMGKVNELQLMKDEPQIFPFVGISNMGRSFQLEDISYISSDSELLVADADGKLTAKLAGTYMLTVRGTWNGIALTREFPVRVAEEGVAEPRTLRAELTDADGWLVDASGVKTVTPDGRSITLSSSKQFALYQGKKYMNELMDFNVTIHASGGWPSIIFRDQNPTRGIDDTTYILTIKPDVLELQRFNGGVRTVIYGSIAGSPSLGGPALPNTMLPYNQRHRLQLGAVNEEGGVRLIVKANGQTVFNYLDTDSKALRGAGYIGVYARSGSITLEQTGAPELYLNTPHSVLEGSALEADLGLSHVADSLHGEVKELAFQLDYDQEVFNWLGFDAAESVTAQVYAPQPGRLTIDAAAEDVEGYLTDGDLLKLRFEAKMPNGSTRLKVRNPVMTDSAGEFYELLSLSVPLRVAAGDVPPQLSSNADLSGLALSAGTLSPAFNKETVSYSAEVGNSTSSISVTAAVYDSAAAVKVNGVAEASGSAVPVALSVGSNSVQVTVTAQDGTAKTYTVTVTRRSNAGGSPSTITEPIKDATVSPGSLVVKKTLDGNGHAVVELAAADLLSALKLPVNGNVTIDIQASATPSVITVGLPLQSLKEGLADGAVDTITIQTALANIILSADMLMQAAAGAEAKTIKLSVAEVDDSELPDSVRSRIGTATVYDFSFSAGDTLISNFTGKGDVTVELEYVLHPGENPEKIVVYYLDDQGQLQAVKNSKYDKTTEKLVFSPKHFSKYVGLEAGVSFNDLATVPWAESFILNLAARGIVDGAAEGQYLPDAAVTRAEYVKLLVEALELDTDAGQAEASFTDIVEGEWYGKYIAAAKQAGIAEGKEDGRFGVNDPITREDIAVMSYRTLQHLKVELKNAGTGASTPFADQAAIAGYAEGAVDRLSKAGVVAGLNEGKFAPKEQATRAQAATIVYRILQKNQ